MGCEALLLQRIVSGRQIQRIEPNRSRNIIFPPTCLSSSTVSVCE